MTSANPAPTQATTVLPATAAMAQTVTEEEETGPVEEKKRSPWTWPLIALIALLALILIGTIIALVAQPKPQPTTTPVASPTQSAPPPSPTPTPTPTSNTVQINEADFVGLTSDQARQKIQSLGMVADIQTGSAATSAKDVDHVYSINPTGPVQKGSTISAKVYAPVTPIQTPTDTVTPNPPSGQGMANSPIVVSFGSATCPAGQNLTGRALFVNGQQQTPVNDTKVTWSPNAAGQYSLTYAIFCNQGDSVMSGQSPAADYKVLPALLPTNPPATP
jgi:serine/threonine-protein kinase